MLSMVSIPAGLISRKRVELPARARLLDSRDEVFGFVRIRCITGDFFNRPVPPLLGQDEAEEFLLKSAATGGEIMRYGRAGVGFAGRILAGVKEVERQVADVLILHLQVSFNGLAHFGFVA